MPRKRRTRAKAELPHRYSSYNPSAPAHTNPADDLSLEYTFEHRKRRLFGKLLAILFLILLVTFLVIGVWDSRNISAASQKMFGTSNIFELASAQSAQTDSNGRINILLAGYSVDDPEHPAATLTDSIILLSMNGATHTGYMLSIPRDLYVNIPGFGYAKINEAYKDGGMPLLQSVVSQDFGLQISYYALIDYAAVKDTVNALGGITVNIQSTDPRGLFDPNISSIDGGPLKLSNGVQKIDGQTALNLTRARGDPCTCGGQVAYGFAQSDFDRTQHQRQVLTAIKDKLNWKMVLLPWKNQQILDAVASNVKTDIPAQDIRSVFGTFNNIPSSKLQSLGLRDLGGKNYLSSYRTPYGQDALIPSAGINDYSAINEALTQYDQ